jgi:F0F1-type ATP synthase membrane subunit b/b'
MKCPNCSAEALDGKRFCADCGVALSPKDQKLRTIVQQELSRSLKNDLRDGKIVERELAEGVALKVFNWARIFGAVIAVPLTLLVITLGFLGYRKYEDFTSSIDKVEAVINPKIQRAEQQAEATQRKAAEAQNVVDNALNEATTQLTSISSIRSQVTQVATRVGLVEKDTTAQIESSRNKISAQIGDVEKKLGDAVADISEQRKKLADTNELISAVFSKGVLESFDMKDLKRTAVIGSDAHVSVYFLLKDPPIFQTLQLQWYLTPQPRRSYGIIGNVVYFGWGQTIAGLQSHEMDITYVPNLLSKEQRFKSLSVKNGKVFADDKELAPVF